VERRDLHLFARRQGFVVVKRGEHLLTAADDNDGGEDRGDMDGFHTFLAGSRFNSISLVHLRQSKRGAAPIIPNEQSIIRHQSGMPRTPPKTNTYGMTRTQAINPKSNNHRFRTGSRSAPIKAMAITKCPNASQS